MTRGRVQVAAAAVVDVPGPWGSISDGEPCPPEHGAGLSPGPCRVSTATPSKHRERHPASVMV